MNTTIRIEIASGASLTTMEQALEIEVIELETYSGEEVVRAPRPDLEEIAQSLARNAARAHRRIT